MGNIYIHKDGVFNVYSTSSDSTWFDRGITEADLKVAVFLEYGKSGLLTLQQDWDILLKNGTNSRISTLKQLIASNRAGPNEKKMKSVDFIQKFLTLPENYEPYNIELPFKEYLFNAIKENEKYVY